jgi:hypothetical protein
MSFYVYSTATNSIIYAEYEKNASSDIAIFKKWPDGKPMKVVIHGGHGVANKHFLTPKGVVTQIQDHEMEYLLTNEAFIRHMDKGFMTYDKKKVDPAKKVKDMEDKDGSAPITPSDFIESENSTSTNKVYKMK